LKSFFFLPNTIINQFEKNFTNVKSILNITNKTYSAYLILMIKFNVELNENGVNEKYIFLLCIIVFDYETMKRV